MKTFFTLYFGNWSEEEKKSDDKKIELSLIALVEIFRRCRTKKSKASAPPKEVQRRGQASFLRLLIGRTRNI